MEHRKITRWNVPVPKSLDEALEKALELDTHISKADFIRDAVRRELERMGLYPIRRGEAQDDQPEIHSAVKGRPRLRDEG